MREGDAPGGGGSVSGSEAKPGWAAGAGLEVALASHWSAKIEYLHIGLAQQNNIYQLRFAPVSFNGTMAADLVRAGINHRF